MEAFEEIIGYEDIKHELRRIADALNRSEAYRTLGAKAPSGLLLHGDPGVGKTLMANCLIKASGRKAFVCRKTKPSEEFIGTIKETFDAAMENAPSIVYLDDMDKFANDDERHRNSEEFVTVQSCIDELRGKEVFVLATANETHCLPSSLTRAGRFDRVIDVSAPEGEDAEAIVEHYLRRKQMAGQLDCMVIAQLLCGRSCATLETVINEAAVIAAWQRADGITMDHMIEACLATVHHVQPNCEDDLEIDLTCANKDSLITWHEAGHITLSEAVLPGSVQFASSRRRSKRNAGFVQGSLSAEQDKVKRQEMDAVVSLAGKAATEMRFGVAGDGFRKDLDAAYRTVRNLFENEYYGGFGFCNPLYYSASEARQQAIEAATDSKLCEFERIAQMCLQRNRGFLEAVADELANRDVLLAADIERIKAAHPVVPLAL